MCKVISARKVRGSSQTSMSSIKDANAEVGAQNTGCVLTRTSATIPQMRNKIKLAVETGNDGLIVLQDILVGLLNKGLTSKLQFGAHVSGGPRATPRCGSELRAA